jgi:H2-forming N5,N10-methylenetetrahydromethanopterin dehydrogenase-like enzyme
MATQKEIHELIGRVVADPDFRTSLADDPEKAVKDAGYDLTEEQMSALKQADVVALGEDLEDRVTKSLGWYAVP